MSTSAIAPGRELAQRTAQWAAVVLGFSIPISVALDNVLLVVVLAGWLLALRFGETRRFVAGSRTATAALLLYGLLLAGTLYGERDPGEAGRVLLKYLDLLFIPIFAVLLVDPGLRRRALLGLAASLGLILAISYLLAAGVPFPRWMVVGNAANPAVFKQYLTHGILIAYAAFLFTWLALEETAPRRRWVWVGAAALAAVNVMVVMQSRSGHVVLVVLALYLGYGWLRWRGLAVAAVVSAAVIGTLTMTPGTFQERHGLAEGNHASSQAREWAKASNKQRLDFYRASIAIVQEHPVAGVGTGGFPRAYAEKTRGTDAFQTRNPHNEYLQMATQLGAFGLAALLWLFWQHWRESPRLATPLECHLSRGLLLAIAVTSLFNSPLLDHTEGLLYAWLTGMLFGGLKSPDDGSARQGQ